MDDMCTDNRFELIERFKKKLIDSTNIETSPEEMKAIDNLFFRFWQMGWLDIIDRMPLVKESTKTLMHSVGNSVSAKAFRNAGRFIQNAIDGEAPEFEKIPSAQPKSEERTAESEQNVPNGELISKKAAIEFFLDKGMITAAIYVSRMPFVQPALYGYNIKHLKLIAEILQKENLPPEKVVGALTNIERIITIVMNEFEETLRESMNQFKN